MITEFLTPKHDINLKSKNYSLKKSHYAIVFANKTIVGLMPDFLIYQLRFVMLFRKGQNLIIGIWKVKKIKQINTKPLEYEVNISTFSPPVDTSLKLKIPEHPIHNKLLFSNFFYKKHFKKYLQ